MKKKTNKKTGTARWIESLDLPISKPWHPWSAEGSNFPAGYTQVYEGEGISSTFTYTTVRDAGHMVSRYKPSEALHMFKQFIADQPVSKTAYI